MADNLGPAAVARQKAKTAIKEKRFDDAWRLLHKQREYYDRHIRSGYPFTETQARCMQSQIDEDFANILRLEGKHKQALVHIIFWVGSHTASGRITATMDKKLLSYFNRCKFLNQTIEDVKNLAVSFKLNSSMSMFVSTQKLIDTWQ